MNCILVFLLAGLAGLAESLTCPDGYIEFQDCCVAHLNGSKCPEGGYSVYYQPGRDGNYTLPPGIGTTVEFGSGLLFFNSGQETDTAQWFCRVCPGSCEMRQYRRYGIYDYALFETRSSFKTANRLCNVASGGSSVIEWVRENVGSSCQNGEEAWMSGLRGCEVVKFAPDNNYQSASCDDIVQYVVCRSLTTEPFDRANNFLDSLGVPRLSITDLIRQFLDG